MSDPGLAGQNQFQRPIQQPNLISRQSNISDPGLAGPNQFQRNNVIQPAQFKRPIQQPNLISRQSNISDPGLAGQNRFQRNNAIQPAQFQRPIVQPNLVSRQSKLSAPAAGFPRPIQIPQQRNNLIPRQNNMPFINDFPQRMDRRNNSRQSKLSVLAPQKSIFNSPPRRIRNRRIDPISRQSKISIINSPEQRRPRSDQSIPLIRRPLQRFPSPPQNRLPDFPPRNRRLTPVGRVNTGYITFEVSKICILASTNALSTYSEYETLDFFPLVVGNEEPEIFTEGIQSDGWISEPQ
jgi:hypothetical protein